MTRRELQGEVMHELQRRRVRALHIEISLSRSTVKPNPHLWQLGMYQCQCGHIQNIERLECQHCDKKRFICKSQENRKY